MKQRNPLVTRYTSLSSGNPSVAYLTVDQQPTVTIGEYPLHRVSSLWFDSHETTSQLLSLFMYIQTNIFLWIYVYIDKIC